MCHITLCQTTVHLVSLHSLQMQIVLVSNYSALIGEWSFVMSMCVCFVYLQSYLWNYTSNLHQIFLHVTYGRGLVLLWWLNDTCTLCISSFTDDIIFAIS